MNKLLDNVYKELNFLTKELSSVDNIFILSDEQYIEKGQWLNLSNYLNNQYKALFKIEKLFFVQNNPFIIFTSTKLPENKWNEIYNKIWNIARPRFLFLSNSNKLQIFDLYNEPVKTSEELNPLETVEKITEIVEKLKNFRRERIETGAVFGDERFNNNNSFANTTLINDLKIVRRKLFYNGLDNSKLNYAHALIGRSIFIRYLEDRKIITRKYFEKVAKKNKKWQKILNTTLDKHFYNPDMKKLLYPRVLSNFDFTFAFFEQLSEDFNGDLFPTDKKEKTSVKQKHLNILQEFLIGEVDAYNQQKLFLWAYKFDIIPIELISNIYEEFYHFQNQVDKSKKQLKDGKGTYYTPVALVDYVLTQTLNIEQLKNKPVIMDTACGSGIFLVEAFRRIVRYELYKKKTYHLNFNELLEILKNQIRGIELNSEAIKISAFSLYLAFLHYQTPPDIQEKIDTGNKLPMLIYKDKKQKNIKYFDILLQANAFDDEKLFIDPIIKNKFISNCADIVVANPPWGKPAKGDKDGEKSYSIVKQWCKDKNKPISSEQSQAFLWRATDLLKPNGIACMLVSGGVLLRNSEPAQEFKDAWLNTISLQNVTNFIHVRDIFFKEATSPFFSLKFKNEKPKPDNYISYWTARNTKIIEKTQCVVLSNIDFKYIKYSDITNDIWKIYYWGNYKDYLLLNMFQVHNKFNYYIDKNNSGRGFELGRKSKDADWLKKYEIIPTKLFNNKYNEIKKLEKAPHKVNFKGKSENLYFGKRFIIKAGITQKNIPKGQIISKLINKPLAFNKSFYGIHLQKDYSDKYEIILGILWSSLTRYYFFLTASRWTVWHDDILFYEILNLPINLKTDKETINKIIEIVNKLRNRKFTENNLEKNDETILFKNQKNNFPTLKKLEEQLDEAIFDLYMLSPAQRNLIKDRCKYDINHFYQGTESIAVHKTELPQIKEYINIFLNLWRKYIDKDEKLTSQYYTSFNKEMLALIFTFQEKGQKKIKIKGENEHERWNNVLNSLEKAMQIKYSEQIYTEGIIIVVTTEQIFIIKQNQQRLWTQTEARTDAESTSVKAYNLSNKK